MKTIVRFAQRAWTSGALLVTSAMLSGCWPTTVQVVTPTVIVAGTDEFLDAKDFYGSFDVDSETLPPTFGGKSRYNGRIVFANLPVDVVQTVLPNDLQLAPRITTQLPGMHPVLLMYGYQLDTAWLLTPPFGAVASHVDYKEIILLIPFVQSKTGSGKWHNYAVRMYLDADIPIWLGNIWYGYFKDKAAFTDPGTATPLSVLRDSDGVQMFSWTFTTVETPIPHSSAVFALENYTDALQIMSMPILGTLQPGQYNCAYWVWETQGATAKHIDVDFNFVNPFRPTGMNSWLGAHKSVPKGAFEILGVNWELKFPPFACRF